MLCQRAHAVTGCITDYAFPCDAHFLLHLWGINLASFNILNYPKQNSTSNELEMQILFQKKKKQKNRPKKPNDFTDFGNHLYCPGMHPELTTHQSHGNSSPSSKFRSQKKWSPEHCDQLHTFSLSDALQYFWVSFVGWFQMPALAAAHTYRNILRVETK